MSQKRIRNQILYTHLQHLALRSSNLADGLTYHAVTATHNPDNTGLTGGLTAEDLMRFAYTPLKLDVRVQTQLRDALLKFLLSLYHFWIAGEDVGDQHQRVERAMRLPDDIRARRKRHETLREEKTVLRGTIGGLVKEINEIHPRLERTLLDALTRFPPSIHTERTLRSEVLATTIETCLLKLSLMRYRAYTALYHFSFPSASSSSSLIPTPTSAHPSSSSSSNSMPQALSETHALLLAKQHAQATEEEALDAQLRAYEDVMALVGSGFRQVVEDMARVQREVEECRRDLRRLGWSGD